MYVATYASPDDSGVLVTFLSGLGEGAARLFHRQQTRENWRSRRVNLLCQNQRRGDPARWAHRGPMRPPVRLISLHRQRVPTVHEAKHFEKPNRSFQKSRTYLASSQLYTHVHHRCRTRPGTTRRSTLHDWATSNKFHAMCFIPTTHFRRQNRGVPILLGHRHWTAMELWVLRHITVCSPHLWQNHVCDSCHPCYGSATAPKHSDLRHTAHGLENERCEPGIVECARRHLQQARRIEPYDWAENVSNPTLHLLIKFAAPWPLSSSDVSCRRVGALVAQEPTVRGTDLPQAESSVYALYCLFLFLNWEMMLAAHGRGTQSVRFQKLNCQSARDTLQALHFKCEGSGDVVRVLTLLVGGVAQAFHDDRVVELRVQLGVAEVDGEGQEGTGRSRKGEASQRECAMDDMEMVVKRLRT